MTWVATAIVGGAIIGGAASSRAAGKATDAQTAASRDAIAAQERAQERALELQRPFYEAGYAATAAMMDMTGLDRSKTGAAAREAGARERGIQMGDTYLPSGTYSDSPGNKRGSNIYYEGQRIGHVVPGGASGRFVNDTGFDVDAAFRGQGDSAEDVPGDLSSYEKYDWRQDPGYQGRMDESMRALERGASARGILNSGGTVRGALRYAQEYASAEYQKVFDRISRIAGSGQSAANTSSDVIVNTGANTGRALINAGEARASGYVAQGNAWSNAATQVGTAVGYAMGDRFVVPRGYGGTGYGGWPYTTPGYGDGVRVG